MKVQVTAIQPSSIASRSKFDPEREIGTFDVFVLIGTQPHKFRLAVDLDRIGEHQIQIVNAEVSFEETFKYNLKLNQEISQLVLQVYNSQAVEFPVDLGEFESSKIQPVPRLLA